MQTFSLIWLAMRLRMIKTSNGMLDPLFTFTGDYTKEVIILACVLTIVAPILLYILLRDEKKVAWIMVTLAILAVLFICYAMPD